MSEPLMQKHEQKIRHFGECTFSSVLQFKHLHNLCGLAPYCTEQMLTNERPGEQTVQLYFIRTDNNFTAK